MTTQPAYLSNTWHTVASDVLCACGQSEKGFEVTMDGCNAIMFTVSSHAWGGDAEGIARLTAAAPDLLAALKRIAFQGDYCPTEEELDGIDKGHYLQILGRWEAGELARAAIAKATGE